MGLGRQARIFIARVASILQSNGILSLSLVRNIRLVLFPGQDASAIHPELVARTAENPGHRQTAGAADRIPHRVLDAGPRLHA